MTEAKDPMAQLKARTAASAVGPSDFMQNLQLAAPFLVPVITCKS